MKKFIFIFSMAFLAISYSCTQDKSAVQKETFMYSEKEGQKLYLDKYVVASDKEVKPCVIFMFGGGFIDGTRDEARYIPYFDYLAKQGYCVVSIDYRLGFKDYTPNPSDGPVALLNRFAYAIGIAVEDLFDATSFVVGKASEWNVNPSMIVANGSSAGAVSVLEGEYYISNGHEMAQKLPKGFNYAGVIGFAGAIFAAGDFRWEKSPCPIQMFHGDADAHVPYDKVSEMGVGLYGSEYIASTLDSLQLPYYFYSVTNVGHEMATLPMDDNRCDITVFLDRMVMEKKREEINTVVTPLGVPDKQKDFSIMDYVKSNFGE